MKMRSGCGADEGAVGAGKDIKGMVVIALCGGGGGGIRWERVGGRSSHSGLRADNLASWFGTCRCCIRRSVLALLTLIIYRDDPAIFLSKGNPLFPGLFPVLVVLLLPEVSLLYNRLRLVLTRNWTKHHRAECCPASSFPSLPHSLAPHPSSSQGSGSSFTYAKQLSLFFSSSASSWHVLFSPPLKTPPRDYTYTSILSTRSSVESTFRQLRVLSRSRS